MAQLYVRDLVASRTRPVRELKGFQRIDLAAGESQVLTWELPAASLSFHDGENWVLEPGEFQLWIGEGAEASLMGKFNLE